MSKVDNKISAWGIKNVHKFQEINNRLRYLDQRLFSDYEIYSGASLSFENRLVKWLDNTSLATEQQSLFELTSHFFYVGKNEFNLLYREAYQVIYKRWLIDKLKVSLDSPALIADLNEAVEHTWFCPLTDSLRINEFYHVNNIPAKIDFRPDWRSLVKFGDPQLVKKYLKKEGIKYLVLLEDFVGNGGQISKAVEFAAMHFKNLPILIIPLIICPSGVTNSISFSKAHKNVQITPIIQLPIEHFVSEVPQKGEQEIKAKVRKLAVKRYLDVSCGVHPDDDVDPYGPFGWRRTGALVIMYSNTPNNTLPLIHFQSETWFPLFLRHKRI